MEKGSFNDLGIYIGRDKEISMQKNFWDKITRMKKQFNIWGGRNLTMFGKVLISKTFGISNLVYSISMTETPNSVIENAQREINKFIWNNKPNKIKHSTLIGKYEWGGAKATDMKIMKQSLSIAWIARLWVENNWNSIIRLYLSKYGGLKLLLRCNYDYKELNMPDFYKNVLRYANNVLLEPNDHQIIWNNKDIKIGGNSIFYNDWFERGIIFVQDCCNGNGCWLSYNAFATKYNLRNCSIKFMGIVNCLKNLRNSKDNYRNMNMQIRPQVNFQSPIFNVTNDNKVDVTKAKSKIYYDILIERNFEPPISMTKWNLEIGLTETDFKLSLVCARMSTKDTKLLDFNFKLIHRILNNNYNLNKWSIKESPNCELCSESYIDDTIHALVDCSWTYNKIDAILADIDPNRIFFGGINWKSWLFGVNDPAINVLLLIIKRYLCQIRSGLNCFSLLALRKEIYYRILSEKKTMSEQNFDIKWSNLQNLVQDSLQFGKKFLG